MGLTSELIEATVEPNDQNQDESWPLIIGLGIIIVVVVITVLIVRMIFKYLKRAKDKIREKL